MFLDERVNDQFFHRIRVTQTIERSFSNSERSHIFLDLVTASKVNQELQPTDVRTIVLFYRAVTLIWLMKHFHDQHVNTPDVITCTNIENWFLEEQV